MLFSDYTINKDIPIPLYYQVKKIILELIDSGKILPNEAIPTEKEFCELYDISRTTIRQAITELVNEGKLYRIKSKGTFVAPVKVQSDLSRMWISYVEGVQSAKAVPDMKVLSIDLIHANEFLAEKLQIPVGDQVIRLIRSQTSDNQPTSYIKSFVVYPAGKQVMDPEKYKTSSLYKILSENEETAIGKIVRKISAYTADSQDAKELHIKPGEAVLLLINHGFSAKTGKPVIYEPIKYVYSQNELVYTLNYFNPEEA